MKLFPSTDPPSPMPPWWVFWLVRPHKVSYKVSYKQGYNFSIRKIVPKQELMSTRNTETGFCTTLTPEARSVAQTPAAPGRRSVHCHMPAAGSLQGACRWRKAITLADCLANHARKMAQLTEGMRVFFEEGGPTSLRGTWRAITHGKFCLSLLMHGHFD